MFFAPCFTAAGVGRRIGSRRRRPEGTFPMGTVRACIAAAILFLAVVPTTVRASTDCGFRIDYAELVAVGAAHREGLYLISIIPKNWADHHVRYPAGFH